ITLVRDGSRDPMTRSCRFRQAQIAYALTGIVFFLAAWPIGIWIAPDATPAWIIAVLAFSELVSAPMIMPVAYRFQSEERMNAFGMVLSIAPTVRFIATVALFFFGSAQIDGFVMLYGALLAFTATAIAW